MPTSKDLRKLSAGALASEAAEPHLQDKLRADMRDSTKVLIGFGCIWGLFELGAFFLGSFTLGSNDTAPERFALLTSGLGVLPCCLLAIRRQRTAAWLLILIAAICTYGYTYQMIVASGESLHRASLGELAWLLFLTCAPGMIGVLLLRAGRSEATPGSSRDSS